VNASEKVQVIGTDADGRLPSGLFTQAQGTGNAGELKRNKTFKVPQSWGI
ncbi:MAG: hypothetical protein F6K20_30700, partial [Moorea sp. SIO2C4]|nr:hypothetical protein [Moorena sp. SIO2C4]